MAPGGVETSVFHNTIVPESAQVDFSFGTPGMRIFKLILSWYLTWLGDFNFIRYMSFPKGTGQYLIMPMWSIYGKWIQQMINADILRRLSAISYGFLVLQFFNNRQATLINLENGRLFKSCMGRSLH